MRGFVCGVVLLGVRAMSVAACGGGGSTSVTGEFDPDQTRGTTTCGQKGTKVELHGTNCEIARTMVTLLNGRAKHSILTPSDETERVRWVCVKPSRSIYSPLRCSSGKRWFAMQLTSHQPTLAGSAPEREAGAE